MIAAVTGTRPEALKLAPVIHALSERGRPVRVIVTGQQRAVVERCLAAEGLAPSAVLAGAGAGPVSRRLASLVAGLRDELARRPPRLVLVQGDTLSACAGALGAASLGIPVAHVEAGLRSHHWRSPFPEEALRTRIARVASLHFAPNALAAANLAREGVPARDVHVVGNPGIDRLRWHLARTPRVAESRTLVVTLHRHEHRGRCLDAIGAGLRAILAARPDLEPRIVLHPNPCWSDRQRRVFETVPGARLLPPLAYGDFIQEMRAARLVLTDSGGVQEEVPYLGVATVIVRRATERPGSLEWPGCVRSGPEPGTILAAALALLAVGRPAPCAFDVAAPHGDGHAATRIADLVLDWLPSGGVARPAAPPAARSAPPLTPGRG